MQPEVRTSAIIALALALTLSIKIAGGPTIAQSDAASKEDLRIAAFLERQGFTVGAPLSDINPPMFPARKSGCTLNVAEVSPSGWHQDVLAQITRPGERLFFVFRGKMFSDQPTRATILDQTWRRLLGYAGFSQPERPVLGIVASGQCTPQDLPWDEVAEFY